MRRKHHNDNIDSDDDVFVVNNDNNADPFDSLIAWTNPNKFAFPKIVFVGDSLTYGNGQHLKFFVRSQEDRGNFPLQIQKTVNSEKQKTEMIITQKSNKFGIW
eukprot:UN26691